MADKPKGKNSDLKVSNNGRQFISKHEGVRLTPYNDQAQNCTVGIGDLLHKGPCTDDELKTPITASTAQKKFDAKVTEAAGYVRKKVADQSLTQAQFDALTSFVYNVGVGNAQPVLSEANKGKLADVPGKMQNFHLVSIKDPKTGKVTYQTSQGLVTRREDEVGLFNTEPGPAAVAAPPAAPGVGVPQPK
jgi:lysozyme